MISSSKIPADGIAAQKAKAGKIADFVKNDHLLVRARAGSR